LVLGPILRVKDDPEMKRPQTDRKQLEAIAKKHGAEPLEKAISDELSLPNDPLLAEQWYLYPSGDKRGSPGSIHAIDAWRHVRPAAPIVVALLDSGVNYTHPDLAANIWKNERELLNGKDDDGNGYVDDLYGWDFAY